MTIYREEGIPNILKGKFITLTQDLPVWIDLEEYGRVELIIPAPFKSDLASIPWWARMFLPVLGKHNKAAVAHDFLYRNPTITFRDKDDNEVSITLTQGQVDKLFLQIMKGGGVRWSRRKSMYRGVRLGGWKTWNRYRREEDAEELDTTHLE